MGNGYKGLFAIQFVKVLKAKIFDDWDPDLGDYMMIMIHLATLRKSRNFSL